MGWVCGKSLGGDYILRSDEVLAVIEAKRCSPKLDLDLVAGSCSVHLAAGYSPRITAPRVKGGRTWGPEDLGDLGNLSGLGAYSSNTILESSCSVIACFRWYPSNPETAIICRGVVCSSQGYHRSCHVLPTASYSNLLKPNIEPKKVFWIWCSLISYQNIATFCHLWVPIWFLAPLSTCSIRDAAPGRRSLAWDW